MGQRRKISRTDQGEIKPGREAPGVVYTTSDAAPGLKLFRCEPYRATMAMGGCAKRWREAQRVFGEKTERGRAPASKEAASHFERCRSCPIGAAHAGEEAVNYSWLYGMEICPRCRKGTTRMIHNRVCIGCYNRARELASGKNARGNEPTVLLDRQPGWRCFRLTVNGVTRQSQALGADMSEPILHTLRTTKGVLSFSFKAPDGEVRQWRLF